MSFKNVKTYFETIGLSERIKVLDQSSATVELAAKAIGCEEKQIAKTLSFLVKDEPILIVTAGNVKVDNKRYKSIFHQKSKMIPIDSIEEYIGHDLGGVCPFAVKPKVSIYLDVSLKQNDIIYPAAGSENSMVELTIEELEGYTDFKKWIDVCKT